jgi:hypothetical protein
MIYPERQPVEVPCRDYGICFSSGNSAMVVLADLTHTFARDGFFPDEQSGARLNDYRAGQRSVLNYILHAIDAGNKGERRYVDDLGRLLESLDGGGKRG